MIKNIPNQSNTEEFIKKATKYHGNKYDYSLVSYKNNCTKISIICKKHGNFEQTPIIHLRGSGCPICGKERRIANSRLSIDKLLNDFKDIHGDKYDYSLINYINNNTKIKIICKEHTDFEQTPKKHKEGQGCPKCKPNVIKSKSTHSLEQVIKKFKNKHGEKYDYSLVDYINSHIKVKIICPIHNIFEQTPADHMHGGCRKCGNEITRKKRAFSCESMIKKFKNIHGDKYDYSLMEYTNINNKVKIICPKHGVFEQNAKEHLNGSNCRKCSIEIKKENSVSKFTCEVIIDKFKNIHGDKYDYSNVIYKNSLTKIEIICQSHGNFFQSANNHLNEKGCIECRNDKNRHRVSSLENVLEKFKNIHGEKYDYSLVQYKSAKTKIKIICSIHGVFEQKPTDHIKGSGCQRCSADATSKRCLYNQEQILSDFKKIHGKTYDYSKVNYINSQTKISIGCFIHGEFFQSPNKHKSGQMCPKCAIEKRANKKIGIKKGPSPSRLTNEQFIERAIKLYQDKYEYSKVNYQTGKDPVIITCLSHGDFIKKPEKFLQGQGCPLCIKSTNTSHKSTAWLNSLGIEYIAEYRLPERPVRAVDGYDPKTHTIYQYHGDYYHGNPQRFNPNDVNKKLNKTYGELYEKTLKMDQELRDYGYNLVVEWENRK